MDNKLFTLASELCASPAWEMLRTEEYFSLSLPNGENVVFYLGADEEDCQEWVFFAHVGQDSLEQLLLWQPLDSKVFSPIDALESFHQMDLYLFSYNAVLGTAELSRGEARRPMRDPSDEETALFAQILQLAKNVEKPIKLPRVPKHSFMAGTCPNELTAHQIKKLPRTSEKWILHIFLHIEALLPPEGGEPFYPYGLMMLSQQSGKMITTGLAAQNGDYGESFREMFIDAIREHGKPRSVIVVQNRTRDFFKPLCGLFDIEFEKRSSSPFLSDALEDYLDYFERIASGDEAEENEDMDFDEDYSDSFLFEQEDDDFLEDADTWDALNQTLLKLAENPETLPKLSNELLENLLEDMGGGAMKPVVEQAIRDELKKRK